MDNRDYAIIGLLLVIIAMLSYGVINAYNDSQPEVFDLGNCIVTAPAGTHCHNENGNCSFYLHENDSYIVFGISYKNSPPVGEFDAMYNSFKNGSVSKEDMIKGMGEGIGDSSFVLDFNVGDFKGEPEMSILVQNPNNSSNRYLAHLVKHNNDNVFLIMEETDNPSATQMYNNLILK